MERELSFHERYSHVRNLMGIPQPITFLVVYPSASDLPTLAFLHKRVAELQRLWPHLYANIADAQSNKPRWRRGDVPFAGTQLVEDIPLNPSMASLDVAEAEKNILSQEMARAKDRACSSHEEPFFHITRHLPGERFRPAYVTISIQHILADGLGSLRLAQAILTSELDPALIAEEPIPPKMEDTRDIRPSWSMLIPDAFSALILPRLPVWLKHYFLPRLQAWPSGRVKGHPIDHPERASLMKLDAGLVERIKAKGKAEGVRTLHPILKAAWATAVWEVMLAKDHDNSRYQVSITTPRSERDKAIGHTHATGNFIGFIETSFTSTSFPPQTAFWDMARSISASMSDPARCEAGVQAMGMMAYIPNAATDAGEPTSWERFWTERLESGTYKAGGEISNLGFTSLPPSAVDISWIQPASPLSAVLILSVIGHSAGLSCCMTWRDGCVVNADEVKRIEAGLTILLERL